MDAYQYIVDIYTGAPYVVQFAIIALFTLVCIILFLVFILKIIRTSLRIKDNEILKFKKEYEALLVEYLYSGDNTEELTAAQQAIILKLKEDVKVHSIHKSVISILSGLMNEVSGEMSDSITTLYRNSGLKDLAVLKLNSKKWHINAKAIGELRRFKIYETEAQIAGFINHPRAEVRKEAQVYLVHLFKFKGLSFLNELKLPLSEWNQLQLLESLLSFDDQVIGDIKPWLKSPNASVVLFALKLAKIYNQFEAKPVLIELLSHPEKAVRVSTIDVLSMLFGYEIDTLIKESCTDLNTNEQMYVLEHLEE